jgi:NAD+ synthase
MTDRKPIDIVAIQDNPILGDVAHNIGLVRAARARNRDADLLVFSECFVTGYPLQDLASRAGFLRDVRLAVDGLCEEMRGDGGPAILIGGPREGSARPYNAAMLLDTDGTMRVSYKHHLPNEQVYDEHRIFAEGPMPKPIPFRGWMLGVAVCEDFWHGDLVTALVDEGAEILVVINGSHFKVGKQERRLEIARRAVRKHGVPVIYVNQVGGQDEIVFDGGSFATDATGASSGGGVGFQPHEFRARLSVGDHGIGLERRNFLTDNAPHYPAEPLEQLYAALVLGLRDYVAKSSIFGAGVVLGLSGGLDSAITAAVAVDALGADKVLAVRMPSTLTSSESMDDAAAVAALLGIRTVDVAIGGIVDVTRDALAPLFESYGRTAYDNTEENQQARARGGLVLMSISNKLGMMLLTTGNKSEMSVGYATLYGDMCGGFSVLKDVWKTQAFELSRWRNAHFPQGALGPRGPVMPEIVIDKPPTAELSEGQTDEATLGSYDQLDAVLRDIIEGGATPERAAEQATAALGREVTPEYARKTAAMVRRAQYKRRQSPPGVIVSDRDYGMDWRMPIAGRYEL